MPKTIRETRLEANRQLFKLDDAAIKVIDQLAEGMGQVRFMDPRNHIGFDIFDENHDQPEQSNDE